MTRPPAGSAIRGRPRGKVGQLRPRSAAGGLAFFAVYPLCNLHGAGEASPHAPYLEAELGIPFVPAFIWAYLSMYLLFLMPPWFLESDRLVRLRSALSDMDPPHAGCRTREGR